MLFSGIDLHKRTIAIQTVDGEGSVVRQAQLAAQRPALTAYFATLPGPHRAVVECTGMWYWVRDLLSAQGVDLRLGHACQRSSESPYQRSSQIPYLGFMTPRNLRS